MEQRSKLDVFWELPDAVEQTLESTPGTWATTITQPKPRRRNIGGQGMAMPLPEDDDIPF